MAVESQDQDGKQLFVSNCGPCHTLAAAGADGVVGPNLDRGPRARRQRHLRRQLQPRPAGDHLRLTAAGRMPAGIIQGENAKEVAAFVGAYAGQAGSESEPLVDTDDPEEAPRDDPGPCGE